jgi:RHO protein GDP dissociation inhibitor.
MPEPDDPRKVIVKKLALCVPERPDLELDLTGDISQLKKQVKRIILRADRCYVCVLYVNIKDFYNISLLHYCLLSV